MIFLDDVANVFHHLHTIPLRLCYGLDSTLMTLSSWMRRSKRRSLQDTSSLARQLCPLCWSYSWISAYIDSDHGGSHWFTSMSNSFLESMFHSALIVLSRKELFLLERSSQSPRLVWQVTGCSHAQTELDACAQRTRQMSQQSACADMNCLKYPLK